LRFPSSRIRGVFWAGIFTWSWGYTSAWLIIGAFHIAHRIKLPGGGGMAFEVPSEDGEDTEPVKDITGVILYNHPAYAY